MSTQIIAQILGRTPGWVFALFFILLVLGLLQMRTSKKGLRRILILPAVFIVLSFGGVISAFGVTAIPIAAWVIGYIATTILVGYGIPAIESAYNADDKTFTVAGSSIPLLVMMSIFVIKYIVGVSMGMQATLTTHKLFPVMTSLLYGAFSGVFAGRSLRLIRLISAKL